MKSIHTPRIDARYWTAITLASVFGTNMGDFYAHNSGLGIVKGLAVLALLAAIVFLIERFDNLPMDNGVFDDGFDPNQSRMQVGRDGDRERFVLNTPGV